MASKNGNPKKLTTLGTKDTGGRQTNQKKTQHRKLKH